MCDGVSIAEAASKRLRDMAVVAAAGEEVRLRHNNDHWLVGGAVGEAAFDEKGMELGGVVAHRQEVGGNVAAAAAVEAETSLMGGMAGLGAVVAERNVVDSEEGTALVGRNEAAADSVLEDLVEDNEAAVAAVVGSKQTDAGDTAVVVVAAGNSALVKVLAGDSEAVATDFDYTPPMEGAVVGDSAMGLVVSTHTVVGAGAEAAAGERLRSAGNGDAAMVALAHV